jgi:hypothetical protein
LECCGDETEVRRKVVASDRRGGCSIVELVTEDVEVEALASVVSVERSNGRAEHVVGVERAGESKNAVGVELRAVFPKRAGEEHAAELPAQIGGTERRLVVNGFRIDGRQSRRRAGRRWEIVGRGSSRFGN